MLMGLMVLVFFSAESYQFNSDDKQNLLDQDLTEGNENVRYFMLSHLPCIILKYKIILG